MPLFASSSSSDSSSILPHGQHEVFVSFRGEDTRSTFTSHLHAALRRRKIVTFIDNELRRGDEISPALLNAIKKSKVAVVIFSEDYASSKWCLNELVEILECKKGHGQIVIPVFYHVNPSDVRKQTESYGKSFAEHEKKGLPVETLQKWRIALTKASNLSGWDAAVIRDEAVLTEGIVDDIWNKLSVTNKIDNKNLIGIEPKVEKIKLLLNMGSRGVPVVGIWGFGGIGKTTLAYAVFNKIHTQFEGSCFLRNIREESEKAGGLNLLRQQLHSDISGEENGKIAGMHVRLDFVFSRKKVLIVFDDVTDVGQIKNIVGDLGWCNESRFIITARDKQVLRNCDCKGENIYEVTGLCDQEAHQLFSRFAIKQEHPLEDYEELSWKMVDYAKGSPLALEVLGSSLFCKSKLEWESAKEKLKRAPNQKIQGVLKLSFDGLDYEQKNVFLDVACLFKGKYRKNIIDLYDYNIEITLSTLIDRCLVSVDSYGKITMHDLLQAMGQHIDREQSTENPGRRSRLWHPDDTYQVFTRNKGIRAIKGISLDMSKTRPIHLNKNPFIKMSELCFLNIYNSSKKRLSCSEDFQFDSTKLRFLRWEYYPMKSLQSSFSLENLVILEMWHSEVEQLWDGVQPLPNLKQINLTYSRNLTAIPDLSLAPKLSDLHLNYCTSLTSLPSSIGNLSQLQSLHLGECDELFDVPKEFSNLKSVKLLYVAGSPLVVDSVCSHLLGLSNLLLLDLGHCCILELPDAICQLSSLEVLSLLGNDFDKLPENIIRLSKLKHLDLRDCSKLQFLPELPRSLKFLQAEGCSSLKAVPYSLSTLMATTKRVAFSGCQMLDKDAFTTIIQGTLMEIQRRFRERPAQAIEEDEVGNAFFNLSYIHYSGCEILEIFEFQHLGSMISKELSHDVIGGKIVGFAFFVVYKPRQYDEQNAPALLNIDFHCKTTFENGEVVDTHFMNSIPEENEEDDSKVVSIGYTHTSDHRIFPSQYQSILVEMEFSFNDDSCSEVEKCGFHLFSGPVSQEERKETFSSSNEEKQIEISPKRLKIS